MADARGLTIGVVLFGAAVAVAAPCDEDRGQTGLALAPHDTGLAVAAVDDGSVAATAGGRAGDEVVQVNGVVVRGCADWARAVREARHDRKALLMLVRRTTGETALVLGPQTWDVAIATPPPAPVAAAPVPSVATLVAAGPPPTLPATTRVTLTEVLHDLDTLAPADDRPPRTVGLDGYRRTIARLHDDVTTLGSRGVVAGRVAGGLATVLAYHDAAAVAWAADEAEGDRGHRSRVLPPAQHTAPYFADSEAAAVIDGFPFVRDAVVKDPAPSVLGTESAGVWRPLVARTLLWQRARSELTLLSGWLGGGSS